MSSVLACLSTLSQIRIFRFLDLSRYDLFDRECERSFLDYLFVLDERSVSRSDNVPFRIHFRRETFERRIFLKRDSLVHRTLSRKNEAQLLSERFRIISSTRSHFCPSAVGVVFR